jgi:hypothetical protein
MKPFAFKSVLLTLIALLFGMIAVDSATAQSPRATSDYFVALGVNPSSGCSGILLTVLRKRSETLIISTIAYNQGVIVSDYSSQYTVSDGVAIWGTSYGNNRGLAPVNLWPLTPGSKVKLVITMWTLDYEPIYEARVTLNSCDSLDALLMEHGPVHSLTRNEGFEGAGLDGGSSDPTLAAFWKAKNAPNDLRTCDVATTYVGNCGLRTVVDAAVKSKFVNSYNGTIGVAGDLVMLHFYVKADPGYTGGGKVIGTLKLANGGSLKLKHNIPTSAPAYGTPVFSVVTLPASIVSAKTLIKQGFGSGAYSLDAVTLSVLTRAGAAPREALPLPMVQDGQALQGQEAG